MENIIGSFKLFLLLVCFFYGALTDTSNDQWLVPGNCRGLWRPDNLVGRCFGLGPYSKFEELAGVKVATSQDCRSVCCNLGEKCVSWQFTSKKECKIGGVVRLGFEATGTPDWCDPNPPVSWNGKRLVERKANGQCVWQDKVQTDQCFGLGDQRLNATRGALNTGACAKACCADSECEIWQEHPSRGCFFGRTTQCPKSETFEGQRKCIPKFCGGMENEILTKFERKRQQSK